MKDDDDLGFEEPSLASEQKIYTNSPLSIKESTILARMNDDEEIYEGKDQEKCSLLHEGGIKETVDPIDEETRFKRSLYHYRWRWYALTLICLLKVGGNFCYDAP